MNIFEKNLYNAYGFFMKLLGFEWGIGRFINNLEIKQSGNINILDIGCGTGVIGLSLLKKFPKSKLLSTDIRENFLRETIRTAKKLGNEKRISAGISDVTKPHRIRLLDGSLINLKKESFDIISVGAAIGYSKNQEKTIKILLDLIKPGGYFINLEMKDGLIGNWTSSSYYYNSVSWKNIKKIGDEMGYSFSHIYLSSKYFPANLTRDCVILKKN